MFETWRILVFWMMIAAFAGVMCFAESLPDPRTPTPLLEAQQHADGRPAPGAPDPAIVFHVSPRQAESDARAVDYRADNDSNWM